MNKPYTCHNCATEFDAYPDAIKDRLEAESQRDRPSKIKVKCPGCYGNGYTQVLQMIYTLDITGDATLV